MKRIIIIAALFLSASVYAANPTDAPHVFCDFESPTTLPASQFHIPSGGAKEVSIVDNPYKTGKNTSNKVLKIVSPDGANWGGAIFNEVSLGENYMSNIYGVQKVTGYDLVSILMYRESNTHVPNLKTVDVDDDGHGDPTYLDIKPYSVDGNTNYATALKIGQWQEVVFNVTHCHNSGIHFIYIMPDREGSSTVYIDKIVFLKDDEKPVMVSAACSGTATGTTLTLNVSATDDLSNPVNRFLVSTDGNQANATEYKVNSSGQITVTGLTANTSYTFTVWAKDYAGNVSDNSKTVTCSTQAPTSGDWCEKVLTSGSHTVYVSCEDMGRYYRFTIESDEAMSGLGGTFFNPGAMDLRNTITSQTANKIVCEIYTSSAPTFYTPLYVMMPGEIMFSALQNASITWGVCETVPPCVPTSGDTTAYICPGKNFYWRGSLAHDGDTRTITNKAGCDSTVTLHLSYLSPSTGDTTAYICPGKNFYWRGSLAHDGDKITLTNAVGCDSVVTLHLSYLSPSTGDTTAYVCVGENFYWWGSLAHDGDKITLTNAVGCDSVVTLHIQNKYPTTGSETQHVCAGSPYYWYGVLSHDGDTRTITNKAGCDSVVTLHLIEDSYTTSDTTAAKCAPMTWYEHTCTETKTYVHTFTGASVLGCDSIVTLHFTLLTATSGDTTAYVCAGEPFMWHGAAAQDGDRITLTNAAGCDSVVTLHIITKQPTAADTTAYVCAGEPFMWHGAAAQDGDRITLTNAVGCDSVVTLHLTTYPLATGDTTAAKCAPMTWFGHTCDATKDYTHTFVGASVLGCDSIVTLHFTLLNGTVADTTAQVCMDSVFIWHGTVAHDGDQITLTNAAGCDSVVTLHLTEKDCSPTCKELIMRKWDDVLFVNNADSLFVGYQWYRDGQKLEGETKQFLYTSAQAMEGDGHEYAAWAYLTDGTYVETCAKKFEAFLRSAEQGQDAQPAQVYPNPVRRAMPVQIIGVEETTVMEVYNAAGHRVYTFTGNSFTADLPVGCYLIRSAQEGWAQTLIIR